jgi:hypothetical protein
VYVRTHLIPDDLELSDQQKSQLLTEVRDVLKRTSNEELFSFLIRSQLGELVTGIVEQLERLLERFEENDSMMLAERIEKEIADWSATMPEGALTKHDVFSIKGLVFAQLRSWC